MAFECKTTHDAFNLLLSAVIAYSSNIILSVLLVGDAIFQWKCKGQCVVVASV